MVIEPQPHRVRQHELAYPVRAQRGQLSPEHAAHGMAHNVYRLQVQGIEQVVVVDHHVQHVIDLVDTRTRLKARMSGGIDRKMFGEFDQKWVPATQAASPMEKQQGRTVTVGAELGLEHAVAHGNRFFHLSILRFFSFQSLPG